MRFITANGVATPRARGLAALVISAYEGALMQARVAGDAGPLRDTAQALLGLLQHEFAPGSAPLQQRASR